MQPYLTLYFNIALQGVFPPTRLTPDDDIQAADDSPPPRPSPTRTVDFLVDVYGSTRDEELSQVAWTPGQREAFVEMQFAAQDTDYRRTTRTAPST